MIYLVRHGQTEFNSRGMLQGALDSPLTEFGKLQIEKVGKNLKRDYNSDVPIKTYISPLGRTKQTAEILNKYVSMDKVTDETIKEVSFGDWDGKVIEELCRQNPGIKSNGEFVPDWYFMAPNCNTFEQTKIRAEEWLKKVESQHAACAVTHGLFGRIVIGVYTGISDEQMLANHMEQGILYRLENGKVQAIE